MKPKVHKIKRWSAKPADETPICGADREQETLNRTVFPESVTCELCIKRMTPAELRRYGLADELRGKK